MSHFLSSAQKINCQKMWVVYCKNKSFDKKLEIHIYYILIKRNLRFRGGCASFWLEGKERRGAVVHAATLIFLVFLFLQLDFPFFLKQCTFDFSLMTFVYWCQNFDFLMTPWICIIFLWAVTEQNSRATFPHFPTYVCFRVIVILIN